MRARAAIILGLWTAAGAWARGMETAIELDPRFPQAYVLAGTVYYEVADWTFKDSREARARLDSLPGHS